MAYLLFGSPLILLLLLILVRGVLPKQSKNLLDQVSAWLTRYNRPIMITASLVFGLLFLYQGAKRAAELVGAKSTVIFDPMAPGNRRSLRMRLSSKTPACFSSRAWMATTPTGSSSGRRRKGARHGEPHTGWDGGDVNPAPFNARTRVHEYGGASFIVDGGVICFSNYEDQRLYRQGPAAHPSPYPAGPLRYADAGPRPTLEADLRARRPYRCGQRGPNTLAGVSLVTAQASDGLRQRFLRVAAP